MSTDAVTDNQWLVIGKVASLYGVKGWVKVYSYTDPMDNFLSYKRCYMLTSKPIPDAGFVANKASKRKSDRSTGPSWVPVEIDAGRRHGKSLVAHIKGIDNRDLAEQYLQCELAIPKRELPDLEDGEFYWHQLEGLQVITTGQYDDVLLGKVSHLMETGSNDVLVVKACEGSIDAEQRLVPYLPGQFVVKVDIEQQTIVVDWDPAF